VGTRRRSGPCWLAATALAAVLGLPPGARAGIPLELRFDGQALEPAAPPDFSCFSATQGRWVGCTAKKGEAPGAWMLEGLEPGRYRLHVSIDENTANPRRYPGDYEAQLPFEVTDRGPERLLVDAARLIHLTRPGDNARTLEGMLTSCATEPRFDTPRYSWGPVAKVEFAWEPIVTGAEYRVSVAAVSCTPPMREREVLRLATGATAATLTLPPSAVDEQYFFRIEAWRDGRLVGDLYTHDGGTHSWNYRFQVRDASLSRWVYGAAAASLLLLLLGARRMFAGLERSQRRRRARRLARGLLALVVVGAVAGGAYHYYRDRVQERERRRVETERARIEALRQARQREFLAAFVSAAPLPDWWAAVKTPYRVDNVGDLLSAWQGHRQGEEGEREFFKAAYQGILDHPDDEHVVATAIDLLHWVVRDYPHRLALARFGYERYFRHRRRTDNCANCMPGDTTQALAQNLSQLLLASGRQDEAIAVCRRLIEERGAEVSPYKLAETWDRIAWAYWEKGEREHALEVVREALAKYGDTVRGDDLRRTLAQFERER
jgi:tetratricopeptide (TPR) repeat protein